MVNDDDDDDDDDDTEGNYKNVARCERAGPPVIFYNPPRSCVASFTTDSHSIISRSTAIISK